MNDVTQHSGDDAATAAGGVGPSCTRHASAPSRGDCAKRATARRTASGATRFESSSRLRMNSPRASRIIMERFAM